MALVATAAAILLACLRAPGGAFNLDERSALVHRGPEGSMFGFAVSQHTDQGKSWVLVGAPTAQTDQPGVDRGGCVFRCSTEASDLCQQIPFDRTGNQNVSNQQLHQKSAQWFGATLVSTGEMGAVVACAPRYVWYTSTGKRREPVGTCFVSSSTFDQFSEFSPCRTCYCRASSWGYHRQGSCQAGFSAAISPDKELLFVGGAGSYYWQGQVFVRRLLLRSPTLSTKEGPAHDDDSYLGYSMAVGEFSGDGARDLVVGMPRGANLTGKIVLYNSNLTNLYNITGDQLGSYFGYCVAVGDINGDGLDDILIGAPMHAHPNNERKYETGRVYVVYQNRRHRFRHWSTLDGKNSKSRFGMAITSLGDINKDGYGDFAVGAPYDGGGGAVYVFQGSPSGAMEEPSQVLLARTFGPNLRTFGFSLAGGVDMDANEYPDLLVGAYASDAVLYLRGRPVVALLGHLEFASTSKQLDLSEKNCELQDRTAVSCVRLDYCFNYTGVDFRVHYKLDAKKEKNPRMFFLNQEGQSVRNATVSLDKVSYFCNSTFVYVKPGVRDKLTPIVAEVHYSIDDAYDGHLQGQRQLTPVLDLSRPPVHSDTIHIQKNCGSDNLCIPDLQLLVRSNLDAYLLGSLDRMEFDVLIRNEGEDSFESTFYMSIPEGVKFINVNRTEVSKEAILSCSAPVPRRHVLKCDVGNPLPAYGHTAFKVYLRPQQGVEARHKAFRFEMEANSTNQELDASKADNVRLFDIPIRVETDWKVTGASRPDSINYNLSDYRMTDHTREGHVGPEVVHLYSVRNLGPSDIVQAEVFILWPTRTLNGEPLLYLLEQPVVQGAGECETVKDVNYLRLQLDHKRLPVFSAFTEVEAAAAGASDETQSVHLNSWGEGSRGHLSTGGRTHGDHEESWNVRREEVAEKEEESASQHHRRVGGGTRVAHRQDGGASSLQKQHHHHHYHQQQQTILREKKPLAAPRPAAPSQPQLPPPSSSMTSQVAREEWQNSGVVWQPEHGATETEEATKGDSALQFPLVGSDLSRGEYEGYDNDDFYDYDDERQYDDYGEDHGLAAGQELPASSSGVRDAAGLQGHGAASGETHSGYDASRGTESSSFSSRGSAIGHQEEILHSSSTGLREGQEHVSSDSVRNADLQGYGSGQGKTYGSYEGGFVESSSSFTSHGSAVDQGEETRGSSTDLRSQGRQSVQSAGDVRDADLQGHGSGQGKTHGSYRGGFVESSSSFTSHGSAVDQGEETRGSSTDLRSQGRQSVQSAGGVRDAALQGHGSGQGKTHGSYGGSFVESSSSFASRGSAVDQREEARGSSTGLRGQVAAASSGGSWDAAGLRGHGVSSGETRGGHDRSRGSQSSSFASRGSAIEHREEAREEDVAVRHSADEGRSDRQQPSRSASTYGSLSASRHRSAGREGTSQRKDYSWSTSTESTVTSNYSRDGFQYSSSHRERSSASVSSSSFGLDGGDERTDVAGDGNRRWTAAKQQPQGERGTAAVHSGSQSAESVAGDGGELRLGGEPDHTEEMNRRLYGSNQFRWSAFDLGEGGADPDGANAVDVDGVPAKGRPDQWQGFLEGASAQVGSKRQQQQHLLRGSSEAGGQERSSSASAAAGATGQRKTYDFQSSSSEERREEFHGHKTQRHPNAGDVVQETWHSSFKSEFSGLHPTRKRRGTDGQGRRSYEDELQCGSSECTFIRCVAGPLAKDQHVLFGVRSRLWAHTISKLGFQKVAIVSKLVTKVTELPHSVDPGYLDYQVQEVHTMVNPEEGYYQPKPIPWWVILLGILGGLLLLMLIVLGLWKCGFFKRQRPDGGAGNDREPLNRNGHCHPEDQSL